MDLGVAGRVYVITGGAGGLGRATAEVLVAEGARVLLSGRNSDTLATAVAGLGAESAAWLAADNSDPQTPQRLQQAAQQRWGRLDGLLISVGGPPAGPVTEKTDQEWSAAFESVFIGAVRLAREFGAVLPVGGSITFVLSSSARTPLPNMAISNGLRPGLAMVAKTLADELGPAGIRVNGLLPGRIDTPRVAELDALSGDADEARARHCAQIPLGRYGEPAEFGSVAGFLMSPAASFLTGVMLPVDGGLLRSL
ncbi:SDR family oxidoreductase [Nocardioides limicola]|uniref:SDR family oxidoreductase n=1 Tax=Nocardioides limicola TaxID=2803368 RepID=UPI00193B4BA0|nr:SDR family oxidoreductase [Nocardioides sp. DJM-14]